MKAFPNPMTLDRQGKTVENQVGMDLRDYFAAKAMQSFLTIEPQKWVEMYPDSNSMMVDIPKLSYEFSDAMMKARVA